MKVDYSNIGFVRRNFTPVKNKLLNKSSQTESKFEKMLIDANIYFTREKCNYRIGSRWCYYDFFVPYWRLYFELDGGSHNNAEQKEIDTEKDCIVRNKQRFICRISNDYVLNEMTEINFEIACASEQEVKFKIDTECDWMSFSSVEGTVGRTNGTKGTDLCKKITLKIDRSKIQDDAEGLFTVENVGFSKAKIILKVHNLSKADEKNAFIETDGIISMMASHF